MIPMELLDKSSMLEFAADNDVVGFRRAIEGYREAVNETGLWYGRRVGTSAMVLEDRTPLMVAAEYGSVEVIEVILDLSVVDLNWSCGTDESTAMHFAASGGSRRAVDVVKLLLLAGADPSFSDAKGRRPFDVIKVSRMLPELKFVLEDLLCYADPLHGRDMEGFVDGLSMDSFCVRAPCDDLLAIDLDQPSSVMDSKPDTGSFLSAVVDKKEYPADPSMPDIKNGTFATDEFRMYSFKVRPCSRAYSHDWTECPFAHPGENARRRDPRKFHYSCVPCLEFRKGSCRRGDFCEYSHGVFECWLHPAQYRTRLCKDGRSCARRVCFFAHTFEELRSLYISNELNGAAMSSPHPVASAAVMDMTVALNLLPGSPSSACGMPHSPHSPTMSPSRNGISLSFPPWPQENFPNLLLPGSTIQANNQTSRLRSSFNARDIQPEEAYMFRGLELEQRQILNDITIFPRPQSTSLASNVYAFPKSLTPSKHNDLFSAETYSPRFSDRLAHSAGLSPTHKSIPPNHFQQQQNIPSPINTKACLTKNIGHTRLPSPLTSPSSAMMSACGFQPQPTLSNRLGMLSLRERNWQLWNLSLCELGDSPRDVGSDMCPVVGSPVIPWTTMWETSSYEKPDWPLKDDKLSHRLRRSYTVGHQTDEPDVTWVHSLVKDSQAPEILCTKQLGEGSCSSTQVETLDQPDVVSWVDQLHLDQIAA